MCNETLRRVSVGGLRGVLRGPHECAGELRSPGGAQWMWTLFDAVCQMVISNPFPFKPLAVLKMPLRDADAV